MRPFALALALLLATVFTSAVAPAPAAAGRKAKVKPLKFKAPAAVVAGTVIDTVSDTEIAMTISTGQGDFPITVTRHLPYAVELLEVSDDRVTRARVVWGEATEAQPMAGTTASVTAGKTYLLAFGASGVKVTRPDGAEVTGDELSAVQKEHVDLGRGFKLRGLLVGKTFKPGKKVKLEPAQFADVFGTPDELTVRTFTIRFDRRDGDVATFSYWVAMASDAADRALRIDASGTFTVDIAQVLPLAFTLTGPLSGSFDQGGQKMTVKGSMTGSGTKAYRAP